jgi:hypothetical protein
MGAEEFAGEHYPLTPRPVQKETRESLRAALSENRQLRTENWFHAMLR